jgi:hypothetical protein
MHRSLFLPIFIAIVWIALPANASQEGVLVFGLFKVESRGIGESGPVVLSGRQTPDGFESLKVLAFGKTFIFTETQLKELHGALLNGLQLSYERGYAELGGRTLYLRFSKGFTSGIVGARLVTIAESGTISIASEKK